ncbi:Protein of unknown function [Sinosporangium album]|uniref:DUF2630 family protein n=1 Tax=Sinosporangium album TaxID=504805 RepID=A0A1G7S6Q9_9ACTN|nr:DUF2630 family protein [Sinosporangium album]SDG18688.1 Protein of unknown function [Sinosporangium album]
MRDHEILGRISDLVAEERELRRRLALGEVTSEEENQRIRSLEMALDQCWDLLRQRRAQREFGEDPDYVNPRPADEIETYQQ